MTCVCSLVMPGHPGPGDQLVARLLPRHQVQSCLHRHIPAVVQEVQEGGQGQTLPRQHQETSLVTSIPDRKTQETGFELFMQQPTISVALMRGIIIIIAGC